MSKKIIFLFLIILLLATNLYAQEKKEIILGCETSLLPSLVWVAENKGYFKEEGLDIEIKEFSSGRTALKTMLEDGNLDMVTVAQTPIMFNSFKRNDYAVISGMVQCDNDVKILARKDKVIKSAQDLKGKKIGITKGSSGHFFFGLFLTHNGLLLSECETLDFEASKLPQALVDGEVDAISTWEPHIYNAQKALGEDALLFPTSGLFREDLYFVSKKDFIKNNPRVINSFLRAVKKAEEFIYKNKEEAKSIVINRLKIDRKLTETIWDDFIFKLFLDQSVLVVLEDEARWAIRNKLTAAKKVPNYLDYIYLDALEAVKPEAVTIIR